MATARRTGTNEQVTTYGVSKTYTVLDTWEAATDTNHVADNETDVLECYDNGTSFDDEAGGGLSGSTNDATRFRIIRPASGEGHDGTSNNGVHFSSTANDEVFRISEDYSQIQDIIATLLNDSVTDRAAFSINDGDVNAHCIGCIAFDCANAGSGSDIGFGIGSDGGGCFLCLAENIEGHGFANQTATNDTSYYYNCNAIDNGGDGFNWSRGTGVLKNCLSDGNTGDDFDAGGTWTGSDFNSASDATDPAGGGSNRQSQTFTFANAGGNDYHITTGDGGAKDFGTDLSSDGTFAFDDDINDGTMGAGKAGTSFGTWDIGFNEPGAVAVTSCIRTLVGVGCMMYPVANWDTIVGRREVLGWMGLSTAAIVWPFNNLMDKDN